MTSRQKRLEEGFNLSQCKTDQSKQLKLPRPPQVIFAKNKLLFW